MVTSTGVFVCSLSFPSRSRAKIGTTLFMALLCWHSPWTSSVVQNHYRSDLFGHFTCRVGSYFQRLDQKSRNKKFEVNFIDYKKCEVLFLDGRILSEYNPERVRRTL